MAIVIPALALSACSAVAGISRPVTASIQAYSLQLLEPMLPFAVVFVSGTLAMFFTRKN